MHSLSRLALAAGTLLLASCGPTEYRPASGPADTGYQATAIAEDRYLVSFEGNAETSRERVETYLLYRAAEIARQTGHPYFAVLEDTTQRNVDLHTYMTAPGFYGYGGRLGYGPGVVGFPYHTTAPYGGVPRVATTDSYTAYATVKLLEERPEDRQGAFETSSVLTALAPRIERPDEG